jgi:orotate phosphoribosyltransferase/uridine monophosphate synthetase
LNPADDAPEASGRLWLADLLWRLGGVQFGDFTIGRTVRNSPVYVNPKLLIARPDALARVAGLLEQELRTALAMRNRPVEPFDLIAGVPIGGLHIATALSLQMRVPLLYARPNTPDDERPQIEGVYRPGQTALLVDDLATGGSSLVVAVQRLRRAGLYVRDAAVLITREQGARARLEPLGVRLHPLLSVEVLLTHLREAGRVPDEEYRRALQYLHREGDVRPETA